MNRNNWSVLDNGDSEGDGEPAIVCGGCGDCGEPGCHVVDDPDDAAAVLIARAVALETEADELTPHPCKCPSRCLCHARIDLRDRRASLQVKAEYLREEAALLRGGA